MRKHSLSRFAGIFALVALLTIAMPMSAHAQGYQMEQHTPGPPAGWAPEQHIPGLPGGWGPGQSSGSYQQQQLQQQQQQSNSWAQQQENNKRMQDAALQQQAQQAPRPQVQQYERWKQEWYQQHPNEPLPIMPVLEKMHRGEIMQNMNNDFAQMRQRRQAELQHNYHMSKQHQQQINASQHVTWSAAQWKNWDKEYDHQQQQAAQDYLDNIRKAGEMQREEWRRENGVY